MSSATSFNVDQSKISSSGNGLNIEEHMFPLPRTDKEWIQKSYVCLFSQCPMQKECKLFTHTYTHFTLSSLSHR